MRRLRRFCFAAVVACSSVFVGCPHRAPGVDVSTLTNEGVRLRLEKSAQRRQTMQGVMKAGLPGLQGVVVNATVDVAGRAPGDLNVAVRSFFEVPQQVLVARQTDSGGVVTLYDATSGAPRFFRGPSSERTLERVLGFPLAPDDAVALLLARPPIDTRPGWPPSRVRLVSVDEERGSYTASIERPGRGAVVVVVDAKDDTLLSATVARGDGRKLVTAVFDNPRTEHGDAGDVIFAGRVTVTVADTGQQVVLALQEGTFNAPLGDEAFTLEPPEGTLIEEL